MKIIIEYDSSWRNSFLDGSNSEALPEKGRNFIASMTALKKEGNFKERSITKDTVMGILNRLIGDQRKLYQSRLDPDYYFRNIEEKLNHEDIVDYAELGDELIFLRNISGNTDKNSFTGMIKAQDIAFTSNFSNALWGVLFMDLSEVVDFIMDINYQVKVKNQLELNPLTVIDQLEELNGLKPIFLEGKQLVAYNCIQEEFNDVDFKLTGKGFFTPISFYTSALYLQIARLKQSYELSGILTKQGVLSGISKRGFTKKDFMDRYTTGEKKLIWGNPYIFKERIKGEGELVHKLTKASGKLEINLNISQDQALDLEEKINNAGVLSFYLGKKGLAYVVDIRL